MTILSTLSCTSEVLPPAIGQYSQVLTQVTDLATKAWADANTWFSWTSTAVFVGVVLPAVWSRDPERRQAAAEMFDRILRFRRRQ